MAERVRAKKRAENEKEKIRQEQVKQKMEQMQRLTKRKPLQPRRTKPRSSSLPFWNRHLVDGKTLTGTEEAQLKAAYRRWHMDQQRTSVQVRKSLINDRSVAKDQKEDEQRTENSTPGSPIKSDERMISCTGSAPLDAQEEARKSPPPKMTPIVTAIKPSPRPKSNRHSPRKTPSESTQKPAARKSFQEDIDRSIMYFSHPCMSPVPISGKCGDVRFGGASSAVSPIQPHHQSPPQPATRSNCKNAVHFAPNANESENTITTTELNNTSNKHSNTQNHVIDSSVSSVSVNEHGDNTSVSSDISIAASIVHQHTVKHFHHIHHHKDHKQSHRHYHLPGCPLHRSNTGV